MAEVQARAHQFVEEYPEHFGNETAYLREGFVGADVREVVTVLLAMLRSGDRDRTWHAVDFINQAVIRHASTDFTAALAPLGVYRTLRDLLHAPDHNIRKSAIYALGKTTHRPNARYLVAALPTYLDRYPLELDRLLFELFWLSPTQSRRCWEYYERLASSPHQMVRWALVEILGREHPDDGESADGQRLEQLYLRLSHDERYLVSAEAEFKLALLRWKWQGQIVPAPAYRQRKREIQRTEPRLTFTHFEILAGHIMNALRQSDYDLPLLDDIARYLSDQVLAPPSAFVPDGDAFRRWRAGRQ